MGNITQGAHSAGFDVPAQPLHMREVGRTPADAAVRIGALDTSAGPVPVQSIGGDDDAAGEIVVHVAGQFVALEPRDGVLVGEIELDGARVAVVDRDGRISIGNDPSPPNPRYAREQSIPSEVPPR